MKKNRTTYLLLLSVFVMALGGCKLLRSCSVLPPASSSAPSESEVSTSTTTSSEIVKTALAAPVISQEGENKVVWEAVPNAINYLISLNDQEHEVEATHYTITQYGSYEVKVLAVASPTSDFINSAYSNVLQINYYEKLPAPVIDKQDYKTIYWLPVDDAGSYQVYVNDVAYGDPLIDTFAFSIEGFDYGVYALNVTAIPESGVAKSESALSNTITLELINPATYHERLVITILTPATAFVYDDISFNHELKEINDGDISYIDDTVVWSVVAGETFVEKNADNITYKAIAAGMVTFKAALKIDETVFATKEIAVKARPDLDLTLAEYDSQNADANRITFDAPYAGKLYYLLADAVPTASEIISSGTQVIVSEGENTFILNLGGTLGDEVDVYFVLVCMENDINIGNSEVFGLVNVPVKVIPVYVSTKDELYNALAANERAVMLSNDIDITGWVQISTAFTGILDGQGFKIHGATLVGKETGLFKTLGNKAVIRNLVIDNVQAVGFTGARNAILASVIEKDATVTFDNIALTNIYMDASSEGSGRSTAAALVAQYSSTSDTLTKISIKNTYINWRFDIKRNTQVSNVGSIFGTFVSAAPDALTLDNVFVDAYYTGNSNNQAGLIGQVGGEIAMNNVVVHAEKFDGTNPGSLHGVDFGYLHNTVTPVINETNSLLVSYTWNKLAKSDVFTLYNSVDTIPALVKQAIVDADDSKFALAEGVLVMNLLSKQFRLEHAAVTPILSTYLVVNDKVVSWTAVDFATGYEVYVNETLVSTQTTTSYDLSSMSPGDYSVYVIVLGNGYDLSNTQSVNTVSVTIEEVDLDPLSAPVIVLTGTEVSWAEVPNAITYQVYVNNELVQTSPNRTFSLTTYTYGEYAIKVIAIPNEGDYLPSEPSNIVIYANKFEVATVSDLQTAIANNVGFISITTDLDLSTYVTPSVIFCGVLDGNNHDMTNLAITTGATGFFKNLGDGAAVRNINFVSPVVTANGATMAVLSAAIDTGAHVEISNVAIINGLTNSAVVNSSSTQGCLIAAFNNAADADMQVTLNNVYVDYTHNITRAKVQNNNGAVFGTLNAASEKAVIINNSYIKFMIKGWWNNAATVIGNGTANVELNNTVLTMDCADKNAGSSNIYFDSGNKSMTTTLTNSLFVSDSEASFKGTAEGAVIRTTATIVLADLEMLVTGSIGGWLIDTINNKATIIIAGKQYSISVG